MQDQHLKTAKSERLDSWKEIAEYLGCDVRTAMRWEQDAGLPLHRVPGGQRRVVFALVAELEDWRRRPKQQAAHEQRQVCATRAPAGPTRWIIAACLVVVVVVSISALSYLHRQPSNQSDLVVSLSSQRFRFSKTVISIPEGGIGLTLARDLNGDGFPDLVLGGAPNGKLTILWNKGDGSFAAPVYVNGCRDSLTPISGDFDGDGHPDLAVSCFSSNTMEVRWGDGKGNFSPPQKITTGGSTRLQAATLDKNGVEVIIAAAESGSLTILAGQKNRTFSTQTLPMDQPLKAIGRDFNGDGYPDIAALCAQVTCHTIWVFLNRGDGTFGEPMQYKVALAAWQIIATDVDGDGIADLISTSSRGAVEVLKGHSDGTFDPARTLFAANAPMVSPFTSKNQKLLFVNEVWQGTVGVLRLLPNLTVETSQNQFVSENLRPAEVADFNGDGLPDFAFPSLSKGGVVKVVVLVQKAK